MARWVVVILVAMLVAVLSLGAQQNSPSASSQPPQGNDCSQRSIPLTVLKNSNATWDWHSLSLSVGGKSVPIDSMVATPQPPRVLVLVDTSGSMGPGSGTPRWGVGLWAAAFAVEATPLDSPVSFGTFNEQNMFGSFESHREVGKELEELLQQSPRHRTALYSALREAAAQFQPPQFGDAIFLVTDGGDNRSGDAQTKAPQELTVRGIRVFVFLVVDRAFKTAEERDAPELMTELAKTTGGLIFQEPWSKEWVAGEEAKRLMQHVRTLTRFPYELQFKIDQPLQKRAKLKITPPDSRTLELAYPRQLRPCFALGAKSQ